MYRDDRGPQANNVQDLRHELGHVQAQNAAMRQALLAPTQVAYYGKRIYENPYVVPQLNPGQKVALSHHAVRQFSPLLAVFLHFITFGLFSIFHFGSMHGAFPKLSEDDPTSGKGIGFFFIPYYNFYWVFFSNLRLYDRMALQYRLRGQEMPMSRGLVMAAAIVGIIPYVNLLVAFPILWPIVAAQLQGAANRLAAMPPPQAMAAPYGAPPQMMAGGQYAPGYGPVPGQHQVPVMAPQPGPAYQPPGYAAAPVAAAYPSPHAAAPPGPPGPPVQTGPWGYPGSHDPNS